MFKFNHLWADCVVLDHSFNRCGFKLNFCNIGLTRTIKVCYCIIIIVVVCEMIAVLRCDSAKQSWVGWHKRIQFCVFCWAERAILIVFDLIWEECKQTHRIDVDLFCTCSKLKASEKEKKAHNLMRQMVCYSKPSDKLSLETVRKRADTFRKYLTGDWISHLSIIILLCKLLRL